MRTTTKIAPVKEIEQNQIEQKQIRERIDRTNELFKQRCPRIPIGSVDLFGVHTLEYGYLPYSHLPAPKQ